MLYFATFDFTETLAKDELRSGYFNLIAEAEDAEAALAKFKALIEKTRDTGDIFESVKEKGTSIEIFLRSCIEAHSIPPEGLFGEYVSWAGEELPTVHTALPGVPESVARVFEYCDDESSDSDSDSEDGTTLVPTFMQWGGGVK